MREGAHASIAPIVHDAPIVPETKPLDDLLADLQKARTTMAVVVEEYGRVVGHRDRRGHRRGGRGRDRRRDGPRGGRGEAPRRRRLARARPRPGHRPRRLRPRAARSTPTPTTPSAASSSPSSGACRGAATRSARTATRSASSPCATTASRSCASAGEAPLRRSPRAARRSSPSPPECGLRYTSGPRGRRAGTCALGGGGCAIATSMSRVPV